MIRLRDTIGMHYISRLIANPGIDFAAQDLVDIAQRAAQKRSGPKARPFSQDQWARERRPPGSRRRRPASVRD